MTAKLIDVAIQSIDGYIEDPQGKFDWARPNEEVHRFVNDLLRPVATYLYGRRMYETMQGWETLYGAEPDPPVERDFAKSWRAAEDSSHRPGHLPAPARLLLSAVRRSRLAPA